MENCVVTGHKGFIGQNLIKNLVLNGRNVLGWEKDMYSRFPDWKNEFKRLITEFETSTVFHVGADSSTVNKNVNEVMFLNYETTKFFSDLCSQLKIKFIYSSSAANYGIDGELPSNLYGWSKKIAEDIVLKNNQIALRYFNVYGPGEEKKGEMASVAYKSFLKNKNNQKVEIFPGNPTRDFVYVDDVVSANLSAEEGYYNLLGNYFDVGSGESRGFNEVLINLEIPFTVLDINPLEGNGYQKFTKSDSSKWIPNWKPNYTIESGIKKYKEYLNGRG